MIEMEINKVLAQMRAISSEARVTAPVANETGGLKFGDVLKQAISSVNEQQQAAGTLVKQFETGTGDASVAEVMISTFVFALVIAGVMAVFIGTVRSMYATSGAIDVNSRSRFVQERLLFDLRSVVSISPLGTPEAAPVAGAVFRTFTASVLEYGTGFNAPPVTITYKFEDGAIIRIDSADTSHPNGVPVLSGLSDAWFQFYDRKVTTSDAITTDCLSATAIRVSFIPKGRSQLVPGFDDPSSSALVQLRYPSFK